MRHRQLSRPPIEFYDRFPRPQLGEGARTVLVESGHGNRFDALAVLNARAKYLENAKEKFEKSKELRLSHLPNEIMAIIWMYAAEEWVDLGCEYLSIPLNINGNPGTKNGYLLQI